LFNKTKAPAPSQPARADNGSSIPPLPDLPVPGAPAAPAGRPASGAAPGARGLSTLSSDLQFEGGITGGGDLQIDGSIKGDVRVGRLIVGETGAVEGNVAADYIEVRGRVVGGISGKQVKLVATAYVDGDITAEQMSIDIGAYFQGRVLQGRREAPAPTPAPRPVAHEPAPQIIDMKGPGA
jgi:cytoskeletal protein CcmA (bactofilin family)